MGLLGLKKYAGGLIFCNFVLQPQILSTSLSPDQTRNMHIFPHLGCNMPYWVIPNTELNSQVTFHAPSPLTKLDKDDITERARKDCTVEDVNWFDR